MASETLEETKSPEDGSPKEEEEVKDQEVQEMAGEEETEEKVSAGRAKSGGGKRKRGGKREASKKPVEESTVKKERKKRSVSGEKAESVERPARDRKAVERFSESSPRKVSATKILSIEQGPGTKLKDIPNVSFKLAKRKVDENLQVLHTILFGRKSNAHYLKRNIFQFSGYVWAGSEEKMRARMKEKIDKCVKDKLLDFCEVLDIPSVKMTSKKEEISAKLLEFLESPHVTRDVVLADKEKKGKKRKRRTKGISQTAPGETSSDRETKEKKKSPEPKIKKRHKISAKAEKEDEDEGGAADVRDMSSAEENNGDSEEGDHEKIDKEDGAEEPVVSRKGPVKKRSNKGAGSKIKEQASPVKKGSFAKSDKSHPEPVSKKVTFAVEDEPKAPVERKKGSSKGTTGRGSKAITTVKGARTNKDSVKITKSTSKSALSAPLEDDSHPGLPPTSRSKMVDKKKGQSNENPSAQEKKGGKKLAAKSRSKVSAKERGKGKASENANVEPSTEELHSVVSNILQEVDFNTATLADILKQLGTHFNMDLMHRKKDVKKIIEEVINDMSDEEDAEEDAEGEDVKEESDEDGGD